MIKVNKTSVVKDYIEVINEMFDYANKKGIESAYMDIHADDTSSLIFMRGGDDRETDVQRLIYNINPKYLNKICGFRENKHHDFEFIYTDDEYEKDKENYIKKKAEWMSKF